LTVSGSCIRQGRIEARRFRPNIVVSTGSEDPGFVENDWIGRTVVIGDTVRLAITAKLLIRLCGR
jgi:uncharacterized protein YcbX